MAGKTKSKIGGQILVRTNLGEKTNLVHIWTGELGLLQLEGMKKVTNASRNEGCYQCFVPKWFRI